MNKKVAWILFLGLCLAFQTGVSSILNAWDMVITSAFGATVGVGFAMWYQLKINEIGKDPFSNKNKTIGGK